MRAVVRQEAWAGSDVPGARWMHYHTMESATLGGRSERTRSASLDNQLASSAWSA
jgi:hypothetical protein